MNSCACGNLADGNGTVCFRCAALHELGLKSGATDAEVKTAYRLYVKAWHPDRFPGDEKSKSAAQEKLKAINSAYDYLTSPSSKGQKYRPKASTPPSQPQEPDKQRQSSAKQAPPPKPSAARRWGILFGLLAGRFRRAPRWLWGAVSVAVAVVAVFTTVWMFWPKPTSSAPIYYEAEAKKYELTHTPPNIAKIEQQAETLLDQNRYAEAAPLLGQACDAGKARGCADLAYLYDQGKGVAQDESRAVTLATKACKAGDAYGCDSIGMLYEEGRGVTLDYSRAAEFYAKACKGRFSDGCYNLGLMHDNGQGVAKDPSQAAAFYFKACNAGSAEGCNQLAYMYDNGLGVAKDTEKTRQFLTRGCKLGNKWGCDRLKEMQ